VKVVAIPAITSALTAGLSVLFFIGLSRVYGDTTLGRIILIQAAAALVQVVCIPSSWVYLLGASGPHEIVERYSHGQAVEWAGTAVGLAIMAVVSAVSGVWERELLLSYFALSIAASSSCLGYLRATSSWRRYVAWVLMPNMIRLPLVWATPAIVGAGIMPNLAGSLAAIIACYFLVPELFRLVTISVPLVIEKFEWQGLTRIVAGARRIMHNWLFDLGSAATDQADKLLVGSLLGPHVLVAYFFGRRMGGLAVMVTEPIYWELYRRNAARSDRRDLERVWWKGLASAFVLWSLMAGAVGLAILTPPVARFLPNAIVGLFGVFLGVMLLDGLSAANRWSRYLAQAAGRATRLLVVRLSIFGVFAVTLALLAPRLPTWGVVLAMLASLACESAYVRVLHTTAAAT